MYGWITTSMLPRNWPWPSDGSCSQSNEEAPFFQVGVVHLLFYLFAYIITANAQVAKWQTQQTSNDLNEYVYAAILH